ncbi:ABC transporter [Sulfuricaulis limicola]|uniref:ABC transporter n=1 Tax=Sulfuricaulis limicola TaxID=1620215 RepID=A0A1B4XET9_9GAMM|nr:ABC transporter ATP-binding protein [Sulfuricaulis limicola]BAV33325.1 ABC transporter [Sulfuricaulis limicola]
MLHAQNLTLAIAERTLCASLDAELKPGENWVILGANGSGKTTLLHALAGLRVPDAGQIRLDGSEIGGFPPRTRARRIGVLFQEAESEFPATVLETVLTGRYPHLDRWQWEGAQDYRVAEAALEAVGLNGLAQRPLATLSGGERRRVEIAALLAQDAPICLLDEPTNHLDLRHQVQVLELVAGRAHRPGHLNVFVLHDVNLAARFGTHAILLFDHGECRHGPLADMLNRSNLEQMYHCRLREIRDNGNTWFLPD